MRLEPRAWLRLSDIGRSSCSKALRMFPVKAGMDLGLLTSL